MTNLKPLEAIYYLGAVLGYAYLVGRWLLKRHDDAKDNATFLHELRTNHLVHIYRTLRLICEKLGVTYTDPPISPEE